MFTITGEIGGKGELDDEPSLIKSMLVSGKSTVAPVDQDDEEGRP